MTIQMYLSSEVNMNTNPPLDFLSGMRNRKLLTTKDSNSEITCTKVFIRDQSLVEGAKQVFPEVTVS